METGIELITKERKEQLEKHGRSIENDVELNNHYQLSEAALNMLWINEEDRPVAPPVNWDINIYTKMLDKSYEQRLIIAGALIAAEIDRLNQSPPNH